MAKVYIKESKLDGRGLFALKNIKKGEIIFIIKGKKVKFLIHNEKQAKIAGFNWIGLGKNEWIDPDSFGLNINHSCNPNSGIKGRLTVVALKNIKKDEEITFDYSLNESDIFWELDQECKCQHKDCRKIIKSIQFLPEKHFKKKSKNIPKHFKEIYKNFKIDSRENYKKIKNQWIDFIKRDFSI